MSVLPANKLLKIVRGTSFDYGFQYLLGTPGSALPADLTGFTANWVISPSGAAPVIYTTTLNGYGSGVIFGGGTDPTTGIIDLVIAYQDTAAIDWMVGIYSLALMTPAGNTVIQIMVGSIGVVGSLP
jgi:hypothetical protein